MRAIERRPLMAAALALPALALAHTRAAHGQTDSNRASVFIRTTGDQLVAAINDPRLNLQARRQRVAGILRQAVDIEGVGRFILGRWWREASPQELQQYMQLFEETLIRNLSSRFGDYQGVRFQLGRAQQRTEDDVLVNTIVERPNTAPFTLDWRVADIGGQPKVVDVIAEGTSLRLTQRSEYSSVIQRNGGQIAPLLAAMRNQIAQMASREQR